MTQSMQIKRIDEWKSDDILFCAAQRPEERKLFIGSSDFNVYEFDASVEKPERLAFSGAGHKSYVTGLAFVGDILVSGSYDRQLIWWDTGARRMIRSIEAHDKWIRRVIPTAGGDRILSIADDMQCKVWDAASGEQLCSFSDHADITPHNYPSMLYAVTASSDGKWLATGDRVGHVAVWDAASFEKAGEVDCPIMYTWDPKQRRHSIGGIRSLAFSPDGTKLAVGGIGTIGNIDHLGGPARLEVFDWQSGERKFDLEDEKHKGLIEQIAWAPDGNWLLITGGDHKGFLTCYDMQSGELLAQAGSDGHIHGFVAEDALATLNTVGHNLIQRWEMSLDTPASEEEDGKD